MRTRQSSAMAKKADAKAQPPPTSAGKPKAKSTPTESSTASKSGRATRGKRGKPSAAAAAAAEPEVTAPPEPAPAEAIDDAEASHVTLEAEPTRTTRRVVKRIIKRTVFRSVKKTDETPNIEFTEDDDVVEVSNPKSMVKDEQTNENGGMNGADAEDLAINEQPKVEGGDQIVTLDASSPEESIKKQKVEVKPEGFLVRCVTKSPKEQDLSATESKPFEGQRVAIGKEAGDIGGIQEEQMIITEDKVQMISPEDNVDATTAEGLKQVDTTEDLQQIIQTEDKLGSTEVDQEEQMINTENKVNTPEELVEEQKQQIITTEDKMDIPVELVVQHEVHMLSDVDKSDTAEECVEQHELMITSKDKVDIAEDLLEQHKEQVPSKGDKVITAVELVEREEEMITVKDKVDTEDLVEPQEEKMILTEDKVESLDTTRKLAGQQENVMEPTKDEVKTTEELMESQEEQMITNMDKVEPECYKDDMDDYLNEEKTDFDGLLEETDDDKIEGIPEDDAHEQGEEVLDDEHAELNAAAKERKSRKELEVFVSGLDRDVTDEDLKKVYRNAGEVVDVRLLKNPSTNKNKGYAFVIFANKEQASRALSEMKNPVIRGKRCVTSPSEDNDSLFVGNICNTWTKEAIKQKLEDYGIDGVEKITVVVDPKREGLSRGFAFIEFSCHGEAMIAYKRLQKPDAIFGHPERSVKVAFAEPLREPDPEVMAKVKSVFVDGLPPQWDEGSVKEKFKHFGEIVNVVLARNMSTAKRKDFGFVDFTSHEAAVACVESVNNTELVDGHSKVRVRVRLSNPLPKTQAIRGGMAGGFRIARSNGGSRPIIGRGSGRGELAFNRPNFQHHRGFYPPGPGYIDERGFANGRIDGPYDFNRGHNFEHGGRWGFRGAHQGSIRGPPPPNRPNFDRFGHGDPRDYDPLRGEGGVSIGGPQLNPTNYDRFRHGGPGNYDPLRREPFPTEGAFNRPYPGSHINDRAFYDNPGHGIKRPYSMRDQVPGYSMEPSTRRPRFEDSGASASFHGHRYPDAFGADGGYFHPDYYGSDYGRGVNPPFPGGRRPYGRGYHH